MDEGRAKGYATAYMQQQAEHSSIRDWLVSPLKQQAFNKFVLTAQMGREGKVLEHMAPLFPAPFSKPFIPHSWNERLKTVAVQIVTASPETEVIEVSQEDQKLYTERSVFLSNLLYLKSEDDCDATLITAANISHHTITRLLQRGHLDKNSLNSRISLLMSITRDLAQIFSMTSLDQSESYNFLIPYKNGALVARTLKAAPETRVLYQGDQWIFSLRTFLEERMLKPRDRERMSGMEILEDGSMLLSWLGRTREMRRGILLEADFEHVSGWLKANARPHSLETVIAKKSVSSEFDDQNL